jgi:hypothetical protein
MPLLVQGVTGIIRADITKDSSDPKKFNYATEAIYFIACCRSDLHVH